METVLSAQSGNIRNRAGQTLGWALVGALLTSMSGCASVHNVPDEHCCPDHFTGGFNFPGSGNSGCGNTDGSSCDGDIQACSMSIACDVPRELRKISMPEYIIEIPDILLIEATSNLRTADAPVLAGESLVIQVARAIPIGQLDSPVSRQFKQLNGVFVIGTDGYLNLGPEYGKVLVEGESLTVIQQRVETHLRRILTNPQVLVTLPHPQNKQHVAGQHLVRMDGTVGLGIYGGVYVNGMTLQQARMAIEHHLCQHIHRPEVSVDVLAYNTKKYYIIADGGGAGEQVVPLPITGNETVLDAIGKVRGLPTVASKSDIWIARPAPGCGPDQVLPIDWNAIVQGAQTETNYQLLPGDRIYVKADKMITFDTAIAKFTAPFERMMGFVILGNGTVRTMQQGRRAFAQGGIGF